METSLSALVEAQEYGAIDSLVDAIPYAQLIGVEGMQLGNDLIFKLPKNPDNIGNPSLPAIHGGVIGGFMEVVAMLEVLYETKVTTLPKVVDFSIDYIRAGRDQDTFARAEVVRRGRNVVNVSISAWQTSEDTPIANARAHFLIKPVPEVVPGN
ncbi:PaaI family thioesterase [uncultured Umboniibacter sp.]|uniref:PaaI family thioesterase n=1 Tax=uncultured Umboniibacter sp. TaxID=1798917 RepID=UPI00260DAADA|nr:PaaI family thioesterase [uncultured Umboniibacter sp.]